MRIPLIRSGGDETLIAWWEWLFAPIMMPLFFSILLVMAAASVPVMFVYRRRERRQEKQLRTQLAAAGRFMEWAEVEGKMKSGDGTLIIECREPKGPIREWWTEDDLETAAPVPLPASLRQVVEYQLPSLQEYAKVCLTHYVDIETGIAKLTEVRVSLDWTLHSGKFLRRNLSEKYPQGKVVTLLTLSWEDEPRPLLLKGDYESVLFRQPAIPGITPPDDAPLT